MGKRRYIAVSGCFVKCSYSSVDDDHDVILIRHSAIVISIICLVDSVLRGWCRAGSTLRFPPFSCSQRLNQRAQGKISYKFISSSPRHEGVKLHDRCTATDMTHLLSSPHSLNSCQFTFSELVLLFVQVPLR